MVEEMCYGGAAGGLCVCGRHLSLSKEASRWAKAREVEVHVEATIAEQQEVPADVYSLYVNVVPVVQRQVFREV